MLLQILENAVRAGSYGDWTLITQIMGYPATPSLCRGLFRHENTDDWETKAKAAAKLKSLKSLIHSIIFNIRQTENMYMSQLMEL